MTNFLYLAIALLFCTHLLGQEIDPDYKNMIERKYDFPTISPDSLESNLNNKNFIILDTREENEYNVSHIPGALKLGYNNPNFDVIADADTSKTIIVYCSIGVRSENIGKTLHEKGFSNVFNLYGGLFLWADQFRPLQNVEKEKTEKIHGYNRFWGRWIKKAHVVYE